MEETKKLLTAEDIENLKKKRKEQKQKQSMSKTYSFLTPYIRARYSILYLQTAEEIRAEQEILQAAAESSAADKIKILTWSYTTGLAEVTKNGFRPIGNETEDPIVALREISKTDKDSLFIFKDLHPFLENPMVRRLLRDISRSFKVGVVDGKPLLRTLILISPLGSIPEDLKSDISLLDLELPTIELLSEAVNDIASGEELTNLIGGQEGKEKTAEACRGLTLLEARDSTLKSLVVKKLNPNSKPVAELVMHEKALALKKTNILEYYPADISTEQVGGLDNLKAWLGLRKEAFTKDARAFGLPVPRGILLAGVPGAGKSLIAKAAANLYHVPLIRFDLGKVFGSLVGQSESNVRLAIRTAEALHNCILWLDEIDKAFAGMNSSSTGDSGVSQRVFGNIITWMQEKTLPVFIIATSNRTEGLPPELLRKGRFDEIFFVDLPSQKERKDIFRIHVKKRRPALALDLDEVTDRSDGFSGAEIEEVVISALYQAFSKKVELSESLMLDAIENTVPLSRSRKDDIDRMRSWAAQNAVNASMSTTEKNGLIKEGKRTII